MPSSVSSTSSFIPRQKQKPLGPASVLAIGTANPPNVYMQTSFPEFYFNVTGSNHMPALREKFERMCENSGIVKRHMHITEEMLKAHPNICSYDQNSLDVRQEILVEAVPNLGKEAAEKAIKEWGQPISGITHLIFCTSTGIDMPGADWAVMKLLGLSPSIRRVMVYQQGCFAGGTVLRIAKDLAENNKSARVLVICSEITVISFRGPTDDHLDNLVGQALFGDGAAALVVGADPVEGVEKAWFEIHWGGSRVIPGSDHAIKGHIKERGLQFYLSKAIPEFISEHIEAVVKHALEEVFEEGKGPHSMNDLFWVVHPGGPSILDKVEERLKLGRGKMEGSRAILSEYGNMFSPCVLFIMDLMRRKQESWFPTSLNQWGVLLGFGPGLTVETVVLKYV